MKYIPGIQKICNEAVTHNLLNLRFAPDLLKTQEMCDDAVLMDTGMNFVTSDGLLLRLPSVLFCFIPYHLKIEKMCDKVIEKNLWALESVPDRLLTQEMCDIAVRMEPWSLRIIPDNFKSQEMCDAAVACYPNTLKNLPDWFVREQDIGP